MVTLKNTLEGHSEKAFLKAVRDTTKKTLQIRLAKKVLTLLGVSRKDLQFLFDPDTIFVHPQVSAYLSEAFPADDEPILQTFYASDYLRAADADAFCDWMDAHALDKHARHRLRIAFAVDGFRGDALRPYRDHLKFALREDESEWGGEEADDWEASGARGEAHAEAHARAVRHVYAIHGPMRPEVVRIHIENVLVKGDAKGPHGVCQTYKKSLGSRFDRVKEHIETTYIGFETPGEGTPVGTV